MTCAEANVAANQDTDRLLEAGRADMRYVRAPHEGEHVEVLDKHLAPLVTAAAPRTTSLLGISTLHGGQLLVSAGENIERLSSESAFAGLAAAARSPPPLAAPPDTGSTAAAIAKPTVPST